MHAEGCASYAKMSLHQPVMICVSFYKNGLGGKLPILPIIMA